MNRVVTPSWRAWLAIDARSPPLDLLTYQIHIPRPSNAVPEGLAPIGVPGCALAAAANTRTGPKLLERTPCAAAARTVRAGNAALGSATSAAASTARSETERMAVVEISGNAVPNTRGGRTLR